MAGASLLAGEAALRCGCGLVTIATTAAHVDFPEEAGRRMELMSADALELDVGAGKVDAVVLGPGLGQSAWGAEVFARFVGLGVPMVVDADGLRFLADWGRGGGGGSKLAKAGNSAKLAELLAGLGKFAPRSSWVLTPHVGEAAYLLDCKVREVENARMRAARAIAEQFGGVCVLKGRGSLVAQAQAGAESGAVGSKRVWRCQHGNAGMASAGMGDVLSGMVGAFLGQGMAAVEAACAAVWIHARAGDRAARALGQRSLLAGDVIAQLPAVLRRIPV